MENCLVGFTLFIGEKTDMAEGDNITKLNNLVKRHKLVYTYVSYIGQSTGSQNNVFILSPHFY